MDVGTVLIVMIDLLVGLVVGYGFGQKVKHARQALQTKNPRVAFRCDCGHTLSGHDPTTNVCTCAWKTGSSLPCACKQYIGPRPEPTLAELWPGAPKVGE